MSWCALQSFAVRLHHDPALVARLYADLDGVLAAEGFGPREKAWFEAVDPRAWTADVQRRDRVLEALRLEYPAACALAELSAGRPSMLRFFSEPAFHRCVAAGGSLAEAFGAWLRDEGRAGRVGKAPTAAMAALEGCVVAARRVGVESVEPGAWALGPGRAAVEVPGGSLALYAELRARLAGKPGGALPKVQPREPEVVLAEPDPKHPGTWGLADLPAALGELVLLAQGGASDAAVRALLAHHGLEGEEADELLDSLVDEGLLLPP